MNTLKKTFNKTKLSVEKAILQSQCFCLALLLAAFTSVAGAQSEAVTSPEVTSDCSEAPPVYQQMEVKMQKFQGRQQEVMLTKVRVADDNAERGAGFQYICQSQADLPMLFTFEQSRVPSFHMNNVKIPLYIYFMDENGNLVDRFLMQPYEAGKAKTYYSPSSPVKYALEVPESVFTENPFWENLASMTFSNNSNQ